MLFTGRVTSNAVIKTVKDDRQVVSFTITINDSYKRKGNDIPIKTALFINCSYWVNTSVVTILTKGAIVELEGRLSINAYTTGDEAKATLQAHINTIKLHSKGTGVVEEVKPADIKEPVEDLPF
jgi:single-strand DNA-binding protein